MEHAQNLWADATPPLLHSAATTKNRSLWSLQKSWGCPWIGWGCHRISWEVEATNPCFFGSLVDPAIKHFCELEYTCVAFHESTIEYTLWLLIIAMENGLIYRWFMIYHKKMIVIFHKLRLNNQRILLLQLGSVGRIPQGPSPSIIARSKNELLGAMRSSRLMVEVLYRCGNQQNFWVSKFSMYPLVN
jgi:hypothetical protein